MLLLSARLAAAPGDPAWGRWARWGDQGDGTYRNPVLPCDLSDLDCIRAGPDYYAISSTFQFSPGVVILHSRDLVNWTILGHVVADLRQISPDLNWDRMDRYGRGIWAGAIRQHGGRFWVYFGTPDEGYFMSTAASPEGPWAPLRHVLAGPGWDDCCPFWDDDGQGYLVGSNFREGYRVHLWKLSRDGGELVPGSDQVIHQSRGSEANKLYKVDGLYYHLYSEVRPEGRAVMIERAPRITGPYAEARQLAPAQREFREPNQGGLVQTAAGDWYWFTHHGTGDWAGRIASLLPVTWSGGWPVIGARVPGGPGGMVWSGPKPVPGEPPSLPRTSDDFSGPALGPQWEWNYQPRAGQWSLAERPGWLRLHAFRPLRPGDLLRAGDTLTQRSYQTRGNAVVIKLDLAGMADGQRAGLCHFSKASSFLGVVRTGAVRSLVYGRDGQTTPGPALVGPALWLKSTWGLEGFSQYSYSTDGRNFTDFGPPSPLSWGFYRGDRIGIFCYNDRGDAGWVDVDYFSYRLQGPAATEGLPETADPAAAARAVEPRTALPPPADDPLRPWNTRLLKPGTWTDDAGTDDFGNSYDLYKRSPYGTWSNYDEALANPFPVPSPLILKDGGPVPDAGTWWRRRRPEILRDFQTEIYGRVPAATPPITWEVAPRTGAGGESVKLITGRIDNSAFPAATPTIRLALTLPAHRTGPVPVIVVVTEGGRDAASGPRDQVLARGWGYATFAATSLQADNGAGLTRGIIGLMDRGQPRRDPAAWGALTAWAWGLSRAVDYLQTDPDVDARHLGVEGHSRWGKTALWAAASDERWAIVFASCSGEGGAKLLRRNFGETTDNLAGSHWMAGNFRKYGGHWNDLPVDADDLIALVAPRPVFVTGATQDPWSDPRGEFLAAARAGAVYRLLGRRGLEAEDPPPPNAALIAGEVAYREHVGAHTDLPDWPVFLSFAARYLEAPSR